MTWQSRQPVAQTLFVVVAPAVSISAAAYLWCVDARGRWHLEWPCMKRRLRCSSNETDWFTARRFMACVVLLNHKSQMLSVLLSKLKVKHVAKVNRPQSHVWLFCSCCWFTLHTSQTVAFLFVFLFSTFFSGSCVNASLFRHAWQLRQLFFGCFFLFVCFVWFCNDSGNCRSTVCSGTVRF